MPATQSRSAAASRSAGPSTSWDDVRLAPVVLVQGPESLLAERAVDALVDLARERDPQVEKIALEGASYQAGSLSVATSPSLFGEAKIVVVGGAEAATEELVADVTAYVPVADPGTTVVVVHGGGVRGKRMLDAIRASGAPVVLAEAIKKDSDKVAFVTAEFRRARRRIDASGVRALVEALGTDLRELAAACGQLVTDTEGTVTEQVVDRYYGGRVEATGFRVADAAVAGSTGEAVALLRHALATGADPVPLVAALAMKLRALAKVGAARGRGSASAKDLGMAPWQVDRARRELAGWTPEGLATAISAVAQADAEVKGAGRDPVFAVERAVLTIARSHGR
ncbi:DNA polymerase III subunit delta [Cellulosimicrobium arenosum]|uniref:DNA-directed DNA polymerase n=1 Tax=Cellulosimicrobium arenosum TaxID=2708133 RepID=A0A927J2Q8_9MICO|nr:DNA polymerase III subunit delta [Cellulosimicrobium arenosum]MBD8080742.1 DNA polymerase III subunit delta [Cellulosimicrobium arenosum]